MNLRELKEIFRLVEKTDFTEVEIVQGDLRVRIERGKGGVSAHAMPMSYSPVSTARSPDVNVAPKQSGMPKSDLDEEIADKGLYVTSPFVGTFYRAPSPDGPPYVEMGQVVKKGQSLCIIEAMKLMNEIESDFDGKLIEIYAENGQPVEFGEKLFRIEPV